MKICDEHKSDIVYDGKECPLCEAEDEIKDLQDLIDELNDANEKV